MSIDGGNGTGLTGEPQYVQLAFPFKVQRVELPKKPNRYSLAPAEDDDDDYEGGGFLYENCHEVFLGRNGYGPLRIAWDTNIIIDYAEFGDTLWKDDEIDHQITGRYREELEALGNLMHLWMMRDIRVRAPVRQIKDAQRELDENRWRLRWKQLHEFLSALTCIELDQKVLSEVTPFESLPDEATSDEWDESLVAEAIETGCHVFLTGDRRLCRRLQQTARDSFLVIMPPSELLSALARASEDGLGSGDWMLLPDNHKWSHFFRATKGGAGESVWG